MLIPPLRCVLRSLRSSSSARWFPRCDAVVAIAELCAAVAAGDTVAVLLSSSLILPSAAGAGPCNVAVFCHLFSSGDSTATVTALQSGRSPHGGGQRHVPVLQCRSPY